MDWILRIAAALAFVWWAAHAFFLWRGLRGRPSLGEVPVDPGAPLPRLSVVVPALNEEASAEPAMRTLLALDYPDLEIIAVDDRSADRTGEILDRLAAEDPRLRVVHVTELPAGWLGKSHAMHLAGAAASGEWILFTDADVHFEPTALRRAVSWAEARGLGHLVVLPDNEMEGFWERLFMAFFWVLFSVRQRAWKVADPRSRAHIGVGAFNLVRSEAYRRAGGHAPLRMEVLDDVKLGKRIKESGSRQDCIASGGIVSLRWHVGLRGIVEGLTKNTFAAMEFSAARTILGSALLAAGTVWPAAGIILGPVDARLLSAGAIGCMVWALSSVPRHRPVSPLYGLGYPLAAIVFIHIMWRSMIRTYAQGGIVWRGTHYRLADLRRGQV